MKALLFVVVWFILFALCWPLALLALMIWPIIWLISMPLKLIGISIGAALALIKTILFLPARLLGHPHKAYRQSEVCHCPSRSIAA